MKNWLKKLTPNQRYEERRKEKKSRKEKIYMKKKFEMGETE